MKQLSKTQTLIFVVGALLMVIGAGASLLAWSPAPYVFAVGAIAFTSMQFLQRYEGSNFVIRRLRGIMLMSDCLFLLSALLMFASMGNVFGLSQVNYITYIYNKWVLTLLIAAILQLYSTHRIDRELAKEAESSSKKL
jgi:hypothetical protein